MALAAATHRHVKEGGELRLVAALLVVAHVKGWHKKAWQPVTAHKHLPLGVQYASVF
jgi:hypothetical protein